MSGRICKYILDSTLLQDYVEPDEGRQMLQDLLEIIKKATARELGLVSIGDAIYLFPWKKT